MFKKTRLYINQKGLTLVELLAVIVILGIIAVIAVPSVLKVIHDMRDRAFIANAWNMKEAADFYIKQETTSGAGAKEKITYLELVDNGFMGSFQDPDTDKELEPSDNSYVVIQHNAAVAVCVKGVKRNLCTKEGVETPIRYSDLKPSLIVENTN
ncbi:type II secretion system protein [Niallia sp. 03133]|uniref:type II secretion system protein n=1 Tax=Niallia sp. 03133 TaxID=3458060 RepID=UPI00404494B2